MKSHVKVLALCLALSVPAFAQNEASTESVDTVPTAWGFWQCSAQAPRLVRVFTAKGEGYSDDIQDAALEECNENAVFQCWPLGCKEVER